VSIPSLKDLREWGYRRGEAYACRLGMARQQRRQARATLRTKPSDVKHAQAIAELGEARRVIRTSLRSLERWADSECGDWPDKGGDR
jgi:hypothetical protein